MGKVMILSFSENEEEVCQRMLQIISESPCFVGCNILQAEKYLSIGGMKLSLAEKNVVIHGAEVMLTNREFEILYLLAQSPGRIFSKEQTFGYFPELTVVFCQALFPEKSVGIPCFYPGKFPDSGG